jgi:zinc and cadmium transporter
LDGLVIAAAFLADTHVGIATTLAIISHEIPQEISDFGVLVHSGMKPSRALMFNFFSAVFAIVGVCTGWILAEGSEQFEPFLLAFSAGGFMYIAASDLVPELHKERNLKKSSISFVMFLFGIILMMLIRTFVGEGH